MIRMQEDNWFELRTPKRGKPRKSAQTDPSGREDFRPVIVYHNAFETNRHRH